ncbi:hypothetical protein KIN20_033172 [Parelaphostrongylus tenuis]|uniref:Uncharacterized protein n=1 Tax=Parelaphostrongylus tenuis TaxID=148309 RepID=A0AAD5WJ06_PARTN|nr:hypothetical protein KIN20_033172 [Parelaphostrongylus tenuis]
MVNRHCTTGMTFTNGSSEYTSSYSIDGERNGLRQYVSSTISCSPSVLDAALSTPRQQVISVLIKLIIFDASQPVNSRSK